MITKFKLFEFFSDEEDDENDELLKRYGIGDVASDSTIVAGPKASRGVDLYEDDFLESLNKNCTEFLNGGAHFYRGNEEIFDFKQYTPTNFVRRASGGSPNYHLLLLDNLPNWKGIQRRAKSIICSTSRELVATYGYAYLIIPFDGARVSYVDSEDLYFSVYFEIGDKKMTLPAMGKMLKQYDLPDDNYGKLVSGIKKLSAGTVEDPTMKSLLDMVRSGNGVVDVLSRAIKNTVHNVMYEDFKSTKTVEVWTESDCLAVSLDKYKILAKEHGLPKL